MPLNDARSIALSYGFELQPDLNVRVFNREYGVLAGFRLGVAPTDSTLAEMSHDGEVRTDDDRVTRIWFYNDGCTPYQPTLRNTAEANTKAYLDRLGHFARLEAATNPDPYPDHTLSPLEAESKQITERRRFWTRVANLPDGDDPRGDFVQDTRSVTAEGRDPDARCSPPMTRYALYCASLSTSMPRLGDQPGRPPNSREPLPCAGLCDDTARHSLAVRTVLSSRRNRRPSSCP